MQGSPLSSGRSEGDQCDGPRPRVSAGQQYPLVFRRVLPEPQCGRCSKLYLPSMRRDKRGEERQAELAVDMEKCRRHSSQLGQSDSFRLG